MKILELLTEDLTNFREAGIPDEFAKKFLKTYNVNHDTEIKTVSKPKASDFEDGDFVINVLPNGDVVAAGAYKQRSGTHWYKMVMKDGESPNDEYPNNAKEATKGMSTRGKFFKVSAGGWSAGHPGKERGDKPTADEIQQRKDSEDALAGGAEGIYSYMNDAFMPKMRAKMEKMVDDIYTKLRKLDKTKNRFGGSGGRNQQEEAIAAAGAIEEIARDGFTRSSMEEFLNKFGKLSRGFASIPNNERELRKLLQNEPNARAKWAQIVMQSARQYHKSVNDMYYASTIDALKGE